MKVALSLVLIWVLTVSCGSSGSDPSPEGGSTPALPTEIEGVIVSIDSEALGDVTSFDIKDGDSIYTLYIDPQVEYSFPLGHLHEHLETAQPVRCELESRDGELYAQTIDDA
jgi:hypothetical protein